MASLCSIISLVDWFSLLVFGMVKSSSAGFSPLGRVDSSKDLSTFSLVGCSLFASFSFRLTVVSFFIALGFYIGFDVFWGVLTAKLTELLCIVTSVVPFIVYILSSVSSYSQISSAL